jgi:tight adherence protein C
MLADRILTSHTSGPIARFRLSELVAVFKLSSSKPALNFEYQAADFVKVLALLLRNGVPPVVAISWLADHMELKIGKILKDSASDLELGADIEDLIRSWQSLSSPIFSELSQKLLVSIQRGTPIAQQLDLLVQTANNLNASLILKKAGSNETKMLVPTIFLILPITVLFTVYPSLALLQLGI